MANYAYNIYIYIIIFIYKMLHENNAKQNRIPYETSICFNKLSLDFSRVQRSKTYQDYPSQQSMVHLEESDCDITATHLFLFLEHSWACSWGGHAGGSDRDLFTLLAAHSLQAIHLDLGSKTMSGKPYGLANEITTFWMSGL